MTELPAECRADLGHLLHGDQAVEPRHQGIVQRRGDGDAVDGSCVFVAPVGGHDEVGVEHCPGEFLEEQRHAVGLRDDVCRQVVRQRRATGDPQYQRDAVLRAQSAEHDRPDPATDQRLVPELGTRRDDDEQRHACAAFGHGSQHFERGRVGPVCVLEQDERRLHARDLRNDVDQQTDRVVLLPERPESVAAVARLDGQRQQLREQMAVQATAAQIPEKAMLDAVEPLLG